MGAEYTWIFYGNNGVNRLFLSALNIRALTFAISFGGILDLYSKYKSCSNPRKEELSVDVFLKFLTRLSNECGFGSSTKSGVSWSSFSDKAEPGK